MLKDKTTRNLFNVLIILAIIFLFTKVSHVIMPFIDILGTLIVPIIIGVFFYYALRPIARFIKRKTKKRALAAILSILIIVIIIAFVIFAGGNIIVDQFKEAFIDNQDKFIQYGDYLNDKFKEYFPDINIMSKAAETLKSSVDEIASNVFLIFSSVGDFGTQLILIPFVLFYLLKDDNLFKRKMFSKLIPAKYTPEIKTMLKKTDNILTTYINGQLLVALIIGTLMFIGYLIIGMPNALLMSVFSLVTSIIPLIGPFLGVLPAVLIALTIDLGLVIKIAIVAVIVQQLEGNLITPNIMGNKLQLHPLAVIFIVIISVNLLGVLGAFIGIPAFLVLMEFAKTIHAIKKNK